MALTRRTLAQLRGVNQSDLGRRSAAVAHRAESQLRLFRYWQYHFW
jgi:hypothetical protein